MAYGHQTIKTSKLLRETPKDDLQALLQAAGTPQAAPQEQEEMEAGSARSGRSGTTSVAH